MRLTDKNARDLVCPAGMTERVFFDGELAGFGLRIRASGARSWVAQYARHGKTRKVTLGTPAIVTAGAARQAARQIMAAKSLGHDPAQEKAKAREQAAHTFAGLLPAFLERQAKRLKPRSLVEQTRHLMKHARPLHGQPIKHIERRAIADLLATIEAAAGAACSNGVRASLSALMTWAAHSGYLDSNPCAFTLRAIEGGPRERFLDDRELAAVYNGVEGMGDYANIVRLLALTGLRRAEIADLRWSEIDLKAALIELPKERMKNNRPHDVPLSAPALAILRQRQRRADRDLVFGVGNVAGFGAFSKFKQQLDERLGDAAAWVLHDLRRTVSTRLHGEPFSIAPHVVEALLGHANGGVAGVYNKQTYLAERRAALAAWGEHVQRIASGAAIREIRRKVA